ncbi:MAG: hypothetical protein II300_02765 [Bacteroidales bacterium]|nr:hypothetical protein [Bacteroidales bacterium]
MRKVLLSLVVVLLFAACGSKIKTTQDWVALCKSDNIEQIDKSIKETNPDVLLKIFEDLIDEFGKTDLSNESLVKERSKALFYLYTGMTGNLLKDLVDFTDGQRQKYAEVVQEKFTSSGAMTLMIVGLGGEENFKKLATDYANYIKE